MEWNLTASQHPLEGRSYRSICIAECHLHYFMVDNATVRRGTEFGRQDEVHSSCGWRVCWGMRESRVCWRGSVTTAASNLWCFISFSFVILCFLIYVVDSSICYIFGILCKVLKGQWIAYDLYVHMNYFFMQPIESIARHFPVEVCRELCWWTRKNCWSLPQYPFHFQLIPEAWFWIWCLCLTLLVVCPSWGIQFS